VILPNKRSNELLEILKPAAREKRLAKQVSDQAASATGARPIQT
jgi:hypothetical protein